MTHTGTYAQLAATIQDIVDEQHSFLKLWYSRMRSKAVEGNRMKHAADLLGRFGTVAGLSALLGNWSASYPELRLKPLCQLVEEACNEMSACVLDYFDGCLEEVTWNGGPRQEAADKA